MTREQSDAVYEGRLDFRWKDGWTSSAVASRARVR
jgi:hypothetical protein